jgi:DeoR/GlpR family transcriptional regulator of sugar metabolism
MMHVATLNEIDQIVTDRALEPQFQQMLKENQVECSLA